MRNKQGEMARVVAPAPFNARGHFVLCARLVHTFNRGRPITAWQVEPPVRYQCSNCGFEHVARHFLDEELQPLPGLDDEDTTVETRELETV